MARKETAYDYITHHVKYDRPLFEFPSLSSEHGNPYHFWPLLHGKLNELGFRKEAKIFADKMGFTKYSFDESIQLASYFLDFNPKYEAAHKDNIVKEDNDYIYVKIKKELYHPQKNFKQPALFKIKDIETLKEMIDEDFSIKNCYGRTFLHYIENPVLMSQFLKLNEEYKWIDIMDIDNFNGSYLHSVSNLDCFALLFKEMIEICPLFTDTLLFGKNSFDKSAYDVFISLLSNKSQNKESFISTFQNEETIQTLSKIFVCLKEVNEIEYNFLKEQFYKNKDIQKFLEGNDHISKNIDKMFLYVKLAHQLTSNEAPIKVKNKI